MHRLPVVAVGRKILFFSLSAFLLTGTFVIGIYSGYINIGFQLAFQRDFGVLEALFITPINRLQFLVGNTLSNTLTGTMTLLIFFISGLFLLHVKIVHPIILLLSIIISALTSIPWGAFLCSIFLLGRNSRVIYSLFEEPAEFLSGVRFPVLALPSLLFIFSSIYPITHSVNLMRTAINNSVNWHAFINDILWLVGLGLVYLLLAAVIVYIAEQRGKKQGNLSYG